MKKLQEIRQDCDTLQKEVASYLGITQEQYSLYETGKRQIPIKHLRNFCLYFHVSADYILDLPRDLDWPR